MQKHLKIFFLFILSFAIAFQVDAKPKPKQKKGKSTTQKSSSKKSSAKKSSSNKSSKSSKSSSKNSKKSSSKKSSKSRDEEATTVEASTANKSATNVSLKDTTKPGVVVVYASFKPSLRNAAKINFNAATPFVDSTRAPLNYKVPAQNLFFSYLPVPIKPVALVPDSGYKWINHGFVKAGFGSFSTPYAELGLSFGDGKKKTTTINGLYTSSKGKLPYQQFTKAGLTMNGVYAAANNHEWNTQFNYANRTQYLYGYQPSTLIYSKDTLRRAYNDIAAIVGYTRKFANEYGFTYSPSLTLDYFFYNKKAGEFNSIVKVPVTKTLNEKVALKLALLGDITSYKSDSVSINNNLFALDAVVTYKTDRFVLNAGINPSWNKQETALLPDFSAEVKLKEIKASLEGGWKGYFTKNNYRSLSNYNPYIQQPTDLFNTKVNEFYAGIKGAAGNHLTYNGRVSFLSMNDVPVFVNNYKTGTKDGKEFLILQDSAVDAVKIHGEVGYNIQEKFAFLAGINVYQFTKSSFDKPFGLVPFEVTGTLKWMMLKDLYLKSNVFIWDGIKYLDKTTAQTFKQNAVVDLNAAVEYTIMPKLNLWLQFNNLLNSKYQRWNQYEVLGLNVVGGVVYSFK